MYDSNDETEKTQYSKYQSTQNKCDQEGHTKITVIGIIIDFT